MAIPHSSYKAFTQNVFNIIISCAFYLFRRHKDSIATTFFIFVLIVATFTPTYVDEERKLTH